jgi:hypothetical protein
MMLVSSLEFVLEMILVLKFVGQQAEVVLIDSSEFLMLEFQ